jgi:predicted Rossmann fold nucleotide-binding protein DprA/Smf involved in DNA uptake
MTTVLSANTRAILLLTAPLLAGRGGSSSDPLTPGEYTRLARHLRKLQREPADLLIDGRLVLVSPYDPGAGFHVGNAMQRNRLIYALSDAAPVVSADAGKGGTRAGAVEQLEKLRFVPLYVRASGAPSEGLDALRHKGALPWPEPADPGAFAAVFDAPAPAPAARQPSLYPEDGEAPLRTGVPRDGPGDG